MPERFHWMRLSNGTGGRNVAGLATAFASGLNRAASNRKLQSTLLGLPFCCLSDGKRMNLLKLPVEVKTTEAIPGVDKGGSANLTLLSPFIGAIGSGLWR